MFKYAYVALASAAMSVVVLAAADAQQAAITSGGNVTAEEVRPLPPVVVESPSQPITEKKSKGNVASPVAGTPAQRATAQAQQSGERSGVPGVGIYTLGQLDLIGGSTITNEAMWTFNKNSVDQALSILPGVTMQNSGGSRNERDILVGHGVAAAPHRQPGDFSRGNSGMLAFAMCSPTVRSRRIRIIPTISMGISFALWTS